MGFKNRQYMIINVSELSDIDFLEVIQTSPNTVRKSVDGTKCVLKWSGDLPKSIVKRKIFTELYKHERILKILESKEWLKSMDDREIYKIEKEIDDAEAKKRQKEIDDAEDKKRKKEIDDAEDKKRKKEIDDAEAKKRQKEIDDAKTKKG